ncbi:MAG: DciA family protein [Sciscionella sp.]
MPITRLGGTGVDDTAARGDGSSSDGTTRGSDLARQALRAAQQSARSRGVTPSAPRGGARRAGYGGPNRRMRRRWSGTGPDDRDPQPLGRLAARLSVERGWSAALAGGSVFARWSELVGAEVAEHATPISLRGGELQVRAESTAWATQLRLLQRQLLAKIAAALGPQVVRRLRISGPAAPSWRYGPRHVSGRGPRDTYG